MITLDLDPKWARAPRLVGFKAATEACSKAVSAALMFGPALAPVARQLVKVEEQAREISRLALDAMEDCSRGIARTLSEIDRAKQRNVWEYPSGDGFDVHLREAVESARLKCLGITEARRNEPLRHAAVSWFVGGAMSPDAD